MRFRAARRDFEDAAVWYEQRRLGLGAQSRAEVDAAITSLTIGCRFTT